MRIEESESNGEWDWPLAVNTRTAPMGLFSDRREARLLRSMAIGWPDVFPVLPSTLAGPSETPQQTARWRPLRGMPWSRWTAEAAPPPGSGGVAAYIPSLRLSRRSPHLWFDVFADTKWVRETLPWWKIVARKRPAAKLESESWHGKFLLWTSMGRLRWNLHRRGIDFSWRI